MKKVTLRNKPCLPRLVALMLVAILSTFGTKAFAYDFAAKNEDGVTIYYKFINGGKEAEVINSYSYTGYEGNISIPETVKNGIGYMKVTSIGNFAFSGYAKLTSVTIGKNVTSIGENAFAESTGLTSVSIPNSVTTIDAGALAGCLSLTNITIPGSVTSIGIDVFYLCSGLETATINDGVTRIGRGMFCRCYNLKTVTVPSSVKSIDSCAFCDCYSLTSVTIPDGVKKINWRTFSHCSSLPSITIPSSVTSIEKEAFCNCQSLPTVTIPNSVTSIGDSAFCYCYNLTSVTIPNSVTSIGDNAFYYCEKSNSITIGKSVASIGEYAFAWCTTLKTVTSLIQEPFELDPNVFYATPIETDVTLYVPKGTKEKYAATEGWKEFKNIEELSDESSGDEDTSDPDIVVENEDGTNIKFNYGDDTQEVNVAKGDYSGDVTIPETIEYEGKTLQVTTIDDGAFSGCKELTSVTIPSSVTSIGASAFAGCTGLTSATIGNNLKSDNSDGGLKEIGDKAFYGCSNLKSVTIPSSVTSIGEYAFSGCNKLTTVTSRIQEPFAINSNVFDSTIEASATLSVPKGTAEKYKAAEGWKEFLTIKEVGSSTGIEDINAEKVTIQSGGGALNISGVKDGTRVVVYSLTGMVIGSGNVAGGTATIPTALRKGEVAIVRIGDKSVKVMMQ